MRRTLTAILCGLLLAAGPAVSAPTQAAELKPWGSASARDQRVHKGCHNYAYTYRVTTPTNQWSAEVFLLGPRGGKVGSGYFLSGPDPKQGKSAWRLCRASVKLGTYTMRMRVSYIDGYDLLTAWVKPSSFRITRR